MKKMITNVLVFAVLAGSVAFMSGCKSKNPNAGLYGSDNLYGDPLIDDVPLNPDNMGLPMDGDRSMFEPVFFAYDSSQVNPEEAGKVEVIYMDVAQPDQDDILIMNGKMFLEKGGIAMIAIKSQSIDVTKQPKQIFEEVEAKLSKHFKVLERVRLEPYDKDHLFLVLEFLG